MSSLASFLMVTSGVLCLTGALASKGRPAIVAAAVMVLAMVDLAYTALVPAVALSGTLLIVGLGLAVFLRSSTRAPSPRRSSALVASGPGGLAKVAVNDCAESATAPDRCASRADSHSGPTAAVLSAITYPVMAWQVLNHGAHMSGSTHAGGHSHHAGDMSLISTFLTVGVVVLAVCLVICAVHDIARGRPLISLDCWGMAAMIVVMQFLH
ncbi:hypothetical protein [Brevibacterium sp. JSBI002]|uniref:hypothetical protein n=1 Tax=Brevibacterium sp. JSBI002 TaxID=2886045 RepID=UPI00222EBAC4|nr:hypothetical protein [Brevibacterium sp. JSBI002]UZD62484.1 hypothetical protein LJ362_01010 [Brevibacterium sp. JSBI002]